MNAIDIEVMTQHYMGLLRVVPVYEDNSLFSVYLQQQLLGRAQPVKVAQELKWYSHEITDKELLEQVGEWIAYHYPLSEKSFKGVYSSRF